MPRRFLTALVPLIVLLLAAACASAPGPRPGTGDVSFRLLWAGEADLDLHVEDPAGQEINFFSRIVESGGNLDIDCNADVTALCPAPIENVFWPRGFAPGGRYKFWIVYFNPPPGAEPGPVPYTLLVLRGEDIVERHEGKLHDWQEESLVGTYDFTREEVGPEGKKRLIRSDAPR